MELTVDWRGTFSAVEANHLHADAFGGRVFEETEWNWPDLVERHSLGWVTARLDGDLVGFANVPWDGKLHAWIQDVMVSSTARHRGIGALVVSRAAQGAREAGCEWLHVDFEARLGPFYLDTCGFTPTAAGLLRL